MFEEAFGGMTATLRIKSDKKKPTKIDIQIDNKSKAILECMAKNPSISVNKISEITGISYSTISRRIKHMQESGILIRNGSDKTGIWIITQK